MKKLTFSPHPKKDGPFLGGSPRLPQNIAWPLDSQGYPLIHLISLPACFINNNSHNISVDNKLTISVFTPFDTDPLNHIQKAMNENGIAIAYSAADIERNEHPLPLKKSPIGAEKTNEQDSSTNGISKVGGVPCWIQDDESNGLIYFMQIDEYDLDALFPDHRGLFAGGMGYLLLTPDISENSCLEAGLLKIQTS